MTERDRIKVDNEHGIALTALKRVLSARKAWMWRGRRGGTDPCRSILRLEGMGVCCLAI